MNDLQAYWNKSSATIPSGKDPSAYAIEKERLFPSNAIVCDLGSGSGRDGLYFASLGHTVKLIDISDLALERAKTAASKHNLASAIETYQCDLGRGKLPLATGLCDIVYSRLALHYFEPDGLAQLLAEVYRVLKSGGEAYLTLKSPDDGAEMEYLKSTAIQKEDGVFAEDGHTKTRLSVDRLNEILAAAGLPADTFSVTGYTEKLDNRKDKIKSGNAEFIVSEVLITKH